MARYWVDANVFIWGAREPYRLPGMQRYWNWFESQVEAGRIISHRQVFDEVTKGEGKKGTELIVKWIKARKDVLVAPSDSRKCQQLVGDMCEFAQAEFGLTKTIEFTRGADLWLVANACIDSGVVVTQESEKKPVRIPAICRRFGVRYVGLFQMNHELKMDLR
jgi:hypothetical protein